VVHRRQPWCAKPFEFHNCYRLATHSAGLCGESVLHEYCLRRASTTTATASHRPLETQNGNELIRHGGLGEMVKDIERKV
jgi:hypothetical protein